MRTVRMAVVWLVVCCAVAGASVLTETYGWWDIDAGTSWTLVVLLGYVGSLAFGISMTNKPFRAAHVLLGALIIGMASAVPLLVGFGLKALGVGVPWRGPSGDVLAPGLFTWILLAGLILVGQGLGKLVKRVIGRPQANRQAA